MRNVKITVSVIKGLVKSTPGGTKNFVFDQELKGFGVYLTSAGLATFVYRYRFGRRIRTIRVGTIAEMTCTQARDIARDHAFRRRQGVDPLQEIIDARTAAANDRDLLLANYAEDFIARKERSKKPLADYVKSVIRKRIVGALGHLRLDQITLTATEEAAQALEAATGSSPRWFCVYVKQIMLDAERRNVIAKSPLKARVVPQPDERERVLSTTEVRLYMMAAHDVPDVRGDMYEMLMRLPKRKSEVVELPWSELDAASHVWNLPGPRTKNGLAEEIHLPVTVQRLLSRQLKAGQERGGLVFARGEEVGPTLNASARNILDANLHRRIELARAAGEIIPDVEHFTIHDLRTAIATALQRAPFSVPPHVIETMLNHKPPSKVQRTYQRDRYVPEIAVALKEWNAFLDELMGDPADWPGGAELLRMTGGETKRRAALLRKDWPKKPRSKD